MKTAQQKPARTIAQENKTANFQQEQNGVLVSIGQTPLFTLNDCEIIFDQNTGLTIRNSKGEIVASMLIGSVNGNWRYKITGIELEEIVTNDPIPPYDFNYIQP